MQAVKAFLLMVCLMVSCLSPLSADILVMQNGDRLTGKVVKKEGDVLTFESSFAGRVEVKWDHVKELTTEASVRVVLDDGQVSECPLLVKAGPAAAHEKNTDLTALPCTPSDIDMINPEPWKLGEGWQFSGRVNLSLKYERGNTDKDEFDLDGSVTLRSLNNRLGIAGELESDSSKDVQTKDKWMVEGRYNRFLNEKLYGLAHAMCERDEFAELELRAGGGLGAGRQFYDADRLSLLAELLIARIHEEYVADPDQDYWGGGWRLSVERRLLKEVIQVYFEHTGVWDLEQTSKVFAKTWTGLRTPLRGGITGTLELKHEYDRGSAAAAEEEDWTYRLKFGCEW